MRKAHKAVLMLFPMVFAGLVGLYQVNRSRVAQSNQDDAFRVEVSDFNSMINSLNSQVSQLRTTGSSPQVSTNGSSQAQLSTSNVDYAQIAAPTIEGTLLQLDLDRSALRSTLGQTQAADLTGELYYQDSLTYFIVGGVIANIGLRTASSANVTVTFYSDPFAKGPVLCTGTYPLGTIGPGTILTIRKLQCGSGSANIGSVTFQMEWT